MTIEELIVKLQTFPKDTEVCFRHEDEDGSGWNRDIMKVELEETIFEGIQVVLQ